jgi:membrane fusion protein, heavy metal efflux system
MMEPITTTPQIINQRLGFIRAGLLGFLLTALSLNTQASEPQLTVTLTPELLGRISFETIGMTAHSEEIRLPGRVTLNEHRVARIGPSISGRVVEVRAVTGRQVKKGDVLASLNSTELSHAQADYLKAETQLGLQRLTAERARRLYREGIISEVTLREREAAFDEAEVEIHALSDQLGVILIQPRC